MSRPIIVLHPWGKRILREARKVGRLKPLIEMPGPYCAHCGLDVRPGDPCGPCIDECAGDNDAHERMHAMGVI